MRPKKKKPAGAKAEQIVAEGRRARAEFDGGYRGQALKLLPWVCGKCAREFEGKNLRDLTVHHKDHDHHNNPPDGSNWELLCVYCHDDEHSRKEVADASGPGKRAASGPRSTYKAFAGLEKLLKPEE